MGQATTLKNSKLANLIELISKYRDDLTKQKEIRMLKKAFPLTGEREILGNWLQASEMHFEEWLEVRGVQYAKERVAELFENNSIEYIQMGSSEEEDLP